MSATRADVARMAGVSPATVSYVINGGPRPVAAETRDRIERAIDALCYRPSALANAFRRGQTKTIGLLIPSPRNPFYAEMAESVEHELLKQNYLTSIGISSFDVQKDELYLNLFEDRRLDGMIFGVRSSLLSRIRANYTAMPHVVLDDPGGTVDRAASVFTDNNCDVACAVAHLQSHGHRVIGCISGPTSWPIGTVRANAWQRQQRDVGLPSDNALLTRSEVSEKGGANAIEELVGNGAARRSRVGLQPTAVFISTDIQALGVLRACHELGIRVPDDLAIVSYDGINQTRFTHPSLTTMRQPLAEIVRTAVEKLSEQMSGTQENGPPRRVALNSSLVLGESCGCASVACG